MKNIQNLFNFIVIFVFGFSISGCVSYFANILPTSNIVTRHTKEADESKKRQEASEQQRRQVESIINQQLIKNKK